MTERHGSLRLVAMLPPAVRLRPAARSVSLDLVMLPSSSHPSPVSVTTSPTTSCSLRRRHCGVRPVRKSRSLTHRAPVSVPPVFRQPAPLASKLCPDTVRRLRNFGRHSVIAVTCREAGGGIAGSTEGRQRNGTGRSTAAPTTCGYDSRRGCASAGQSGSVTSCRSHNCRVTSLLPINRCSTRTNAMTVNCALASSQHCA